MKGEFVNFITLCTLSPMYKNKLRQSYPPRALDKRIQEDWARDAGESPRVLMSLGVNFGPMG